ncbi:hypothetical protein [Microbacterium sp.]|uniref:hypothetical protein n=1 Tax=Microbacterium sp. TaxID=51671 RepID=UPI003C70B893
MICRLRPAEPAELGKSGARPAPAADSLADQVTTTIDDDGIRNAFRANALV